MRRKAPTPIIMKQLASPIVDIKDHYDAIVIGSGYGGSISASRLSRAGLKVCLLERGREIMPGEFPDTAVENAADTQMNLPSKRMGSRTALYEYHVDDAMTSLVGIGLGGTSLINANVAVRVDPRVWSDTSLWPQALLADVNTRLEEGYQRAERMLGSNPYPDTFPILPKMEAMRKSAEAMGEPFVKLPINVTFHHKMNDAGIEQPACTMCGDCMAGCNHGSKNTTQMNYVPDAINYGAEVYCQVDVRYIERQNERWVVHYHALETGDEMFDAPTHTVSADIVVLGAGTFGSTQILMRSRNQGLTLSDKLGDNFSGNGDVGGMAYNCDDEIRAVGVGLHLDRTDGDIGPTITSAIDMRATAENFEDGIIIEEGTIHSPVAQAARIFNHGGHISGIDTDSGFFDSAAEKARELDTLIRGPYHGAAQHSQVYLVMAHDGSDGKLKMVNDQMRVEWPELGNRPFIKYINDRLLDATAALGGTCVENPAWAALPQKNMVTAHPLGGCIMGDDATKGVVNHKGQVFAGNGGDAVHDGLYVSDGSVLPRSIGTNPLLTISAVTERAMSYLAEDRGLTIDYGVREFAPARPPKKVIGVQFTETMGGYFSLGADDFQDGWDKGEEVDSKLRFFLTIVVEDMEAMIADPDYTSPLTGTVVAPALSAEPLTVTEGRFNLAVTDPNDPSKLRRMKYNMKMTDEDGRCYFFNGFKLVRGEKFALDLWPDTTTLYITVYDGEDDSAPVLGKGILRIYPQDFARQIATFRVRGAESHLEQLKATARFGTYFAGRLYDVYGGAVGRQTLFDPDAPPRKKRPLRAPAPEVHAVETADGKVLRLTRYKGGSKGPVMLVHGLGVSSFAFSLDTIDTNLTEYLTTHGYDVWLFDMRSSIELPYANTPYTCDDIANYDYPAAVNKIREVTGAPDIQAIVHCYGAIAFHMAMLNGLEGVRSAVSSQVGAHINTLVATKAKSLFHLDTVLKGLGIKNLTMYTDAKDGWLDKLYNRALAFNPVIEAEEICDNPVCYRVTFLYAPLYEHDQLNNATHEIMHELFGVASIENFEHLSKMSRAGFLVDADGGDTYLSNVGNLDIPITYIHGAENETWLPEATERTLKWLQDANPNGEYERHTVPLYGHIDCIFGKDAARDVYPLMLEHLEKTA